MYCEHLARHLITPFLSKNRIFHAWKETDISYGQNINLNLWISESNSQILGWMDLYWRFISFSVYQFQYRLPQMTATFAQQEAEVLWEWFSKRLLEVFFVLPIIQSELLDSYATLQALKWHFRARVSASSVISLYYWRLNYSEWKTPRYLSE